ncbi:gas vesicle protein GvpQ [Virgibacillus sediminis]|uniref:Gas vesicle protein GvpQ n=1 Tax=Virgibacillus sediminis TaxID=202260 RepID=A0ABV7A7S6_9BACI
MGDKWNISPGTKASLITGTLTFLGSATPILLPKLKDGISNQLPRVKRAVKRADDPAEFKEEVESEARDEMADQFKDKLKENIQGKIEQAADQLQDKKEENAEKVHSNAEDFQDKAQDALLTVREKLANAKEAGEDFQDRLDGRTSSSSSRSKRRVYGAKDIKGVSHIKSAKDIKGVSSIKGVKNINGYASNR